MAVTGHMNYFNIDSCGLFYFAGDVRQDLDVTQSFDLICDWVRGRPLSQTIPWDPSVSRPNSARCYCKDVYKDEETGDFLIVLWKSESDKNGSIWGTAEDEVPGEGEVVEYSKRIRGKKMIWGRPCYYWVIPDYQTVVSIKFDSSLCDSQLFNTYVHDCITNRVEHPGRKRESTDKGYIRISLSDGDGRGLIYKFKTSLKSLDTSSARISDLSKKVTHVVRRETVRVSSNDERALWVKRFADMVPYVRNKPTKGRRRIEVKAEAKPSAQEIRDIIENNAQEGRNPRKWDNVGFQTDGGVFWVDTYRLRDHITVDGMSEGQYLNAVQLYSEIRKSRQRYVKPLRRAHSAVMGQRR